MSNFRHPTHSEGMDPEWQQKWFEIYQKIVQELAGHDPIIYDRGTLDASCFFCRAAWDPVKQECDHTLDCVWRRAAVLEPEFSRS
jgi:hypothetical protein